MPISTLDQTAITAILKELYPDGINQDLVYKKHKLLGMLNRESNFGGRYKHLPVRFVKPQGVQTTFSTAQSNAYASKYVAFDVTRKEKFQVGYITGQAVDLATTGDESIFINDLRAEIDGVISTMGDALGRMAYRSSGGSFATVGSGTASPITLTNPEDIYFVEEGKVLQFSPNEDGSSPRTGTAQVTKLDEDTGIVTYSGTITSLAVNDYVFVSGDIGTDWDGLASWVPSAAPSATTFFGVDRSVAPTRLAGIRFNGSTLGAEEFFIRFDARLRRSSGVKPDYYFMNPKDFANFQAATSGQRYIDGGKNPNYDYGFDSIHAYGVNIVTDADCPVGQCWAVDLSAFWLSTLGEAPRIINEDGLTMLRSSTADSYEFRAVMRGNFVSDAPGLLARASLPV